MKKYDLTNNTVVISRTDSIGDVVLTLPICAWLKETYAGIKIIFLGRSYTKDVVECYPLIDQIEFWDKWMEKPKSEQLNYLQSLKVDAFFHIFPNKQIAQLVKQAKIPLRIGTSHRVFHWTTCNVKPNFTRKNSEFHEAQLNFELLRNFGIKNLPTFDQLFNYLSSFTPKLPLNSFLKDKINTDKKKVILHTKSQGSAVEWPLEKYIELSLKLVKDNYKVYFSGTEKEGLLFREYLPKNEDIIDISGKSTLGEFITFIHKADVLIACSTGPLHLAAILNIKAIGLFSELRPMHPGRWRPLGKNIEILSKKNSQPKLTDINDITVEEVYKKILN
ncbi:MAG: glycosyltransferase family 9 protein [Brumimicrobium sp.]